MTLIIPASPEYRAMKARMGAPLMPAPVVKLVPAKLKERERRVPQPPAPVAPAPPPPPPPVESIPVLVLAQAARAFARGAFAGLLGRGDGKPVTWKPAPILHRVAEAFQLAPPEIIAYRRRLEFVIPRFVFCFLAKRYSTLSYPAIGRWLGGRDHTTVLHAVSVAQIVADRVGVTLGMTLHECLARMMSASRADWIRARRDLQAAKMAARRERRDAST